MYYVIQILGCGLLILFAERVILKECENAGVMGENVQQINPHIYAYPLTKTQVELYFRRYSKDQQISITLQW